ncbi:MAG TPA: protein kinase [Ktedonobacteraceae bacterium]|nr:protein kinase [Ktedonobacteraceae bacterium]
MANRQGQRLGNYRLIRLLGQGGFAEVYLGEHIFLGTQAAIKVLQVRLADEEMEGFLKEARTIAGLTHPHILRVLEFGVEENVPFLVLEYAQNGTLRTRHPKGSILPLTVIVSYVNQIASALQYIHDRKLIHRDIKPENLLLGMNNEVLLSDFGTATVFQTLYTQGTLELVGTVAYMAPEQIRGKPRPASDQYGLGVVVYEWLCGGCPFQGSFTEVYSQHMLASPPSLRNKNPTISLEVEQVVLTALSKEPEQRFASVTAFAYALEQASKADYLMDSSTSTILSQPPPQWSNGLASETVGLPMYNTPVSEPVMKPVRTTTPSSTPPYATQEQTFVPGNVPVVPEPGITPEPVLPPPKVEPSRGISRRAVVVGLVGLGCVAVAGGAAWVIVSKQNPFAFGVGPTPTPTPIPTPVPGTTFVTYRGHTRPVYTVAWAPNGQYISSGGDDHLVKIWSPTAGKDEYTYLRHSGSVNALAWSPDGMRVASASSDTTVQVWDATTGNRHINYTGHTDNLRTVAWSPDGTRIASGSDDKTVQVWDANTGKLLVTYSGHTGTVWSVSWSPDSSRIASGSVDKTVQVWDAASAGKSFTYTYHGHARAKAVKAVAWSPDGQSIASGGDKPDSTVQIWNAFTGAPHLTYSEHTAGIYAIAWSPDGNYIASSSWGEVRVWNTALPTGNTHTIYTGNMKAVHGVVWSPKERRIASGGDDSTVQIWQAY